MRDKYYNDAIIGNNNIIASFSKYGELIRFCFPHIDGRQFIDHFYTGVKINDSNLIFLHEDVNNKYDQKYIENTNILVTSIENTYFNLSIEQTDCMLIDKNILAKKYIFQNKNEIDLELKFIINSKILANSLENYGSRVFDKGIIQYNHNYEIGIFSNQTICSHKLNDVQSTIFTGIINDKDYIGMSNEVAVSYDLGVINPKEVKELVIYILVNDKKLEKSLFEEYDAKLSIDAEIEKAKNYWNSYVETHSKIKSEEIFAKFPKKTKEIYTRTILLFPLLINDNIGGISAALEADENRNKSGGYAYCWPRDAIFITNAFDLLKMENETEKFYNIFCQKTQSEDGMWEQRFYTDGNLAPCWGYQIDETASVIYGIYKHYEHTKDIAFLEKNLKMCEKALKFLFNYVEHILNISERDLVKKALKEKYNNKFEIYKHASYDLWEMNEGIHLYSISAIIASFETMKNIYQLFNKKSDNFRIKKEKRNDIIAKIDSYSNLLKEFVKSNLIDSNLNVLKRNLNDNMADISVIGSIYPFKIFEPDESVVKNTIDKINMILRTYTGGYLRFENDTYMGGNNPWVITTLWMALYFIQSKEFKKAEECFTFVVNKALSYGFLAEQVNNEDENFKWVIGLGWSHAMFVIVLEELVKIKSKEK